MPMPFSWMSRLRRTKLFAKKSSRITLVTREISYLEGNKWHLYVACIMVPKDLEPGLHGSTR
jgi:hypothetical protein